MRLAGEKQHSSQSRAASAGSIAGNEVVMLGSGYTPALFGDFFEGNKLFLQDEVGLADPIGGDCVQIIVRDDDSALICYQYTGFLADVNLVDHGRVRVELDVGSFGGKIEAIGHLGAS